MTCWSCRRFTDANGANFCSWCGAAQVHNNVHNDVTWTNCAQANAGSKAPLSPRQKGVRQGALIMLSTLLLPFVALVAAAFASMPFELVPLTAILCFVGGLLRVFYALLLEEETAQGPRAQWPIPSAPFFQPASVASTLIPRQTSPSSREAAFVSSTFERRLQPPSITEHTTRLLRYPAGAEMETKKD